MELLELNELKYKLDIKKINLYYNKFKFKCSLSVNYIEYFRFNTSIKQIFERLDSRFNKLIFNKIFKNDTKDILSSGQNKIFNRIVNVINFKEHVKSSKLDVLIKISRNKVDLYYNDESIIDMFINSFDAELKRSFKYYYVVQQLNYDKDVIYLQKSDYNNRLYFNFFSFQNATESNRFLNILKTFNCELSPSLKRESLRRTRLSMILLPHYYINFNDDSILTMLGLMYGNLIRKHCRIEKKINTEYNLEF